MDKTELKNMPYKMNINKKWNWLEGKALELFIEYFITISQGIFDDGIIYHKKKLTHKQQGRITGYADCLMGIDYMINEE